MPHAVAVCACVSAHHSYLIRLSSHYWSDFPKNYIMCASLKSTRLTRALFLTSLHTKTHTHANTRWNSSAGIRFETHKPGLFFFCYNILCLTSFPNFFPPLNSPPIWNYHLFSEPSASQVSAAMCRTHHKQRGPVETGWVLVWATRWVSEWVRLLFNISQCFQNAWPYTFL